LREVLTIFSKSFAANKLVVAGVGLFVYWEWEIDEAENDDQVLAILFSPKVFWTE
jgi:hypothetical protein